MLRWRLLSSAIILGGLLILIWLDLYLGGPDQLGRPGLILAPLGWILAGLATHEMLAMFRAQNLRPVAWTVYGGTFLVVVFACAPLLWREYPADCPLGRLGWSLMALAGGVGLAFVGEMLRYREPGGVIVRVALAVLTIAYVGLLLSFFMALRTFHDDAWGMVALLSMVVVVKVSDSGAYAVGRLIGRHKMTPRLSPAKTIEGAIGSLVAGGLASWLVFLLLVPLLVGESAVPTIWWRAVLYGLIVSVAGMIGDLAESLLKRDMGCKDSSRWLPGLGGILDILDSPLAAAPAAYLCWAAGLVGP